MGEDGAFEAITEAYLSKSHRDHPERGCAIAALGAELSRRPKGSRRAVTEKVRALLGLLETHAPGATAEARRENALATYATMLGAIVLARTVTDPVLSDEILTAAASALPKHRAKRRSRRA